MCIILSPNIIVSALLGYGLGYIIGIDRVKVGMKKIEDRLFNKR